MSGKISLKKHEDIWIWLGLALLAILFRFITFFPLTIDMDESTYLVIADHFLKGDVLYRDVTDVKPPGIFLIFAFVQFLFGKSIFIVRLFAALVVATGGYVLYRAQKNWGSARWPAILTGAVYIFMFNFYFGFSANTEIFFVFFTALAVWSYSRVDQGKRWYLLAGLFLGLGFLVKLHVAFDALAFGLFILVTGLQNRQVKWTLIHCSLLSFGFLVPFVSAHIIFWVLGYYQYYHFVTYEAPFNYSVIRDTGVLLKYFKDGIVTYLPFIAMAIAGFFTFRKRGNSKIHWLFLLLFALEWVAILATGKPHPHYWLQLVPPVALLAGSMFESQGVIHFFSKKAVKVVCVVIGAGYFVFLFNYYHKRYLQRPNHPQAVYDYLKPFVESEDKIYTGDGPQILYWLMDKKSPTPHIHQNHLTYPDKIATYEIDVEAEMDKIFATDPRFVILKQNYPHDFVNKRMERDYLEVKVISDYRIFKRKE